MAMSNIPEGARPVWTVDAENGAALAGAVFKAMEAPEVSLAALSVAFTHTLTRTRELVRLDAGDERLFAVAAFGKLLWELAGGSLAVEQGAGES